MVENRVVRILFGCFNILLYICLCSIFNRKIMAILRVDKKKSGHYLRIVQAYRKD